MHRFLPIKGARGPGLGMGRCERSAMTHASGPRGQPEMSFTHSTHILEGREGGRRGVSLSLRTLPGTRHSPLLTFLGPNLIPWTHLAAQTVRKSGPSHLGTRPRWPWSQGSLAIRP